jgi:putative transposase
MPWRETAPMDQRTLFIADHLRETQTITELCDRYGVSRKTGYKWIARYLRFGPASRNNLAFHNANSNTAGM